VDELEIESQVEQICVHTPSVKSAQRNGKPVSARVGQISKLGMMATLLPSLALAAAGKKKLHIYTGTAFLVFAGLHTTRYSKTLFK
jgi:hypothetical protein